MKEEKKDKSFLIYIAIIIIFSGACIGAVLFGNTANKNDRHPINVYLFTQSGCQYGDKQYEYLQELKDDSEIKNYFKIVEYEVWDEYGQKNEDNYLLMHEVSKKLEIHTAGSPYLVIGDDFSVSGYTEANNHQIKEAILDATEDENYHDLVSETKKLLNK